MTPYQIATPAQLAKLAELVNSEDEATRNTYNSKYYKLTDDIDLSAYAGMDGGKSWAPIGTESKKFKSTFDGGGHKITGLTIDRPEEDNIGLFGLIQNGTVQNLGLVNVSISGSRSVGGVAGVVYGTVENCYTTGSITGKYQVGGVAGKVYGTVENCYSTGSITGEGNIGGVAGAVYGIVRNCAALNPSVAATGTGGAAGRVAGYVDMPYTTSQPITPIHA